MKKYNLSNIMKNAWAIRRMTGCTMSEALCKSWANEKAPKDIVSKLLAAGGKRWTKNGKDRIYLSRIIGLPSCDMSRKVRDTVSRMVNGAYYDVISSKLVYDRTPYTGWAFMNEHIESRFNAIAA